MTINIRDSAILGRCLASQINFTLDIQYSLWDSAKCKFEKKKPIGILIEIGLTSHVNLRSIDILTILSPLIYEHISAFI